MFTEFSAGKVEPEVFPSVHLAKIAPPPHPLHPTRRSHTRRTSAPETLSSSEHSASKIRNLWITGPRKISSSELQRLENQKLVLYLTSKILIP